MVNILLTLLCLLTIATSASAEEPSQENAEAIREQARAAAERAREATPTQWPLNVRWLLWSEETVMVAETTPHLRVLWTLLQAEYKEEACKEARSARLAKSRRVCGSSRRATRWDESGESPAAFATSG